MKRPHLTISARARDKAEVLLAEVNHRVANSLSIVASMIGLQANATKDQATKDLLREVQNRIYAISAVHQRLYSSGDTNFVDLKEYLGALLSNIETAMRDEGRAASLSYNIEPLLSCALDISFPIRFVMTTSECRVRRRNGYTYDRTNVLFELIDQDSRPGSNVLSCAPLAQSH